MWKRKRKEDKKYQDKYWFCFVFYIVACSQRLMVDSGVPSVKTSEFNFNFLQNLWMELLKQQGEQKYNSKWFIKF